jgi:hypothetical protein
LLAAIEVAGQPHVVDAGTLGEYAELIAVRGQAQADVVLPEVAAHLASGCTGCTDDLRELVAMAAEPDLTPSERNELGRNALRPYRRGEGAQERPVSPLPRTGEGLGVGDSGIYAVDLPDVQAAEAEAARRQRLRRLRDWLLVAAAVAIVLIGLSLVGLAYLSRGQPDARLGLTPTSGRAAPNGMACPASQPVKGNRPSMIYHLPGGEFYDVTRPEDCFGSPADAEAAGFRRSAR